MFYHFSQDLWAPNLQALDVLPPKSLVSSEFLGQMEICRVFPAGLRAKLPCCRTLKMSQDVKKNGDKMPTKTERSEVEAKNECLRMFKDQLPSGKLT